MRALRRDWQRSIACSSKRQRGCQVFRVLKHGFRVWSSPRDGQVARVDGFVVVIVLGVLDNYQLKLTPGAWRGRTADRASVPGGSREVGENRGLVAGSL